MLGAYQSQWLHRKIHTPLASVRAWYTKGKLGELYLSYVCVDAGAVWHGRLIATVAAAAAAAAAATIAVSSSRLVACREETTGHEGGGKGRA